MQGCRALVSPKAGHFHRDVGQHATFLVDMGCGARGNPNLSGVALARCILSPSFLHGSFGSNVWKQRSN